MNKDLELARKICEALGRGETYVVVELIDLYEGALVRVARYHLLSHYSEYLTTFQESERPGQIQIKRVCEDILQDFWVNIVIEQKIVCIYEARNGASLKTFLGRILSYYISTKYNMLKNRAEYPHEQKTVDNDEYLSFSEEQLDLEMDDARQQKLIEWYVNLTLKQLSEYETPPRPVDACLLYYRMHGISFIQIAKEFGGDPNDKKATESKAAALRKQYTREKTGSMARFDMIFTSILIKDGYTAVMEDGKPVLKRVKL